MKKLIIFIMTCLLVSGLIQTYAEAEETQKTKPDSPEWTLPLADGGTVTSDICKGKTALLFFYDGSLNEQGETVWPSYGKMVSSFATCSWADTKGLQIILIESSGCTGEETLKFLEKYGRNRNIIYAYGGKSLQWKYSPSFFLHSPLAAIEKDGKIQDAWDQAMSFETVEYRTAYYVRIEGYTFTDVKLEGEENRKDAQTVLKKTNEYRKEAGAEALTLDTKLTEWAMQRAAELSLYCSHERPDGRRWHSILDFEYGSRAENWACGQETAEEAAEDWYNSPGHYDSMVNEDYRYIGIGCFTQKDGQRFWIQLFSDRPAGNKETSAKVTDTVHTVKIIENRLKLYTKTEKITLKQGESRKLQLLDETEQYSFFYPVVLLPGYVHSSDSKTVSVSSDGIVKALKAGSAKIRIGVSPTCFAEVQITVSAPAAKTVDMYRIYNPNSGEHFYTSDKVEKDALVNKHKWKYEGVGWVAPVKSKTPVYRLYNKTGGEHHYTTDKKERDALINKYGWTDEGIGWYSDDAKTVKVYREYNPNAFANNHNYTPDTKEHNALLNKYGWKDEGIAWYAVGGKK